MEGDETGCVTSRCISLIEYDQLRVTGGDLIPQTTAWDYHQVHHKDSCKVKVLWRDTIPVLALL